jgi:CheY-like chemotaxis protein
MDIKMPKMDGYTAAKHIRKLRPNMPIIAQTAYALTHEVEMYTEFFDDFITKPINRHELKEKIARFLK